MGKTYRRGDGHFCSENTTARQQKIKHPPKKKKLDFYPEVEDNDIDQYIYDAEYECDMIV